MSPRDAAIKIIRALRDAGHEALLAGGCVRDELLGLHPKDYDIATDATPKRVIELFPKSREQGKAFAVVQVRVKGGPGGGNHAVEVATFRAEHGYSDRRRPDSVTFTDARADAQRRDFTINALFIDPLDTRERPHGRVIDYVAGLGDLKSRVIRAVGDPDERFREDDLRALRAVRFAARLGFEIEPRTAEAIRRHAGDLVGVSRERIGDEVRRMLNHPHRARAARLLHILSLDGPTLKEPCRGDRSLPMLEGVAENAPLAEALAAWMLDRAPDNPSLGPAEPIDIASASARTVPGWREALCLSNDERTDLRAILDTIVRMESDWPKWGVARRKRLAAAPMFRSALSLVSIRKPALGASLNAEMESLERSPGGIAPEPFVTGDDLVAEGYSPGPKFAQWLDAAYDAQLEGRVASKAEALAMIRTLPGQTTKPA
ncbi:MAG: CCA tRNA nucleotidyltransferase [Phycisphaeraceae bacterium]|nr:CCA tRNA nucleotidyltransferase [Phycisphaerales bacterium]MCB9841789.1 CCA tRNA nucleotidyltransferase [Phycisphaeraceae bacterium]